MEEIDLRQNSSTPHLLLLLRHLVQKDSTKPFGNIRKLTLTSTRNELVKESILKEERQVAELAAQHGLEIVFVPFRK